MTVRLQKFGIIGAGAWGTAMAQTLAVSGRDVTLWAFEPECAAAINNLHENTVYLPGVKLHTAIRASSNLADLGGMDAILAVPPAQHMRRILTQFAPHIVSDLPIILCSKGIEISTLSFMVDVLRETLPDAIPAVLAGPSFAIDVARGLPTAVTLAVENEALGADLAVAIAAPTFRPYLSTDIIGAEIGGAVKNVLAIACGMVLGKGLGRSAHAAIITRGFAEMTRFGVALDAKAQTLTGMCGLGDLVLTCSSEQSRNMSCGMALGKGQSLDEIMCTRKSVTEGVATAPALKRLAAKVGVEMPICAAVAAILDGSAEVDAVIEALLNRAPKPEV